MNPYDPYDPPCSAPLASNPKTIYSEKEKNLLVVLGVRIAELGQDAAAGEGRHINVGDESNLARQAGRSILGAVDALELVLLDVGLGLGHLNLGADDEALPL